MAQFIASCRPCDRFHLGGPARTHVFELWPDVPVLISMALVPRRAWNSGDVRVALGVRSETLVADSGAFSAYRTHERAEASLARAEVDIGNEWVARAAAMHADAVVCPDVPISFLHASHTGMFDRNIRQNLTAMDAGTALSADVWPVAQGRSACEYARSAALLGRRAAKIAVGGLVKTGRSEQRRVVSAVIDATRDLGCALHLLGVRHASVVGMLRSGDSYDSAGHADDAIRDSSGLHTYFYSIPTPGVLITTRLADLRGTAWTPRRGFAWSDVFGSTGTAARCRCACCSHYGATIAMAGKAGPNRARIGHNALTFHIHRQAAT